VELFGEMVVQFPGMVRDTWEALELRALLKVKYDIDR
jgi:hypothetical protein